MTEPQLKPPVSPQAAILIGILAVSTASIFIRYAQQEAGSLVIAAYRLTVAALILAPAALLRHRPAITSLSGRDLRLGMLSGFFLTVHFATWITSLEYTSIASSVVLVTTTPLWVALFSPIFLKERISGRIALGLGLALAGTILVGLSDVCNISGGFICPPLSEFLRGQAFLGDFLALCGAWAAAGYVMIGRSLRSKLSLVPYIFIVYGMASIGLVGLVIASGQPVFGFMPATYLWLGLLAIIPQLLGHSIFNWALGYLSATYVAITLLGEPVGSTILAYVLLNEVPSPLKGFGAILILGGIVIASQNKTSPTPS